MRIATDSEKFELLLNTIKILKQDKATDCFVLKGGMVLVTLMYLNNRSSLSRRTEDIDIHCANKEAWLYFKKNIAQILNNNTLGYRYTYIGSRLDKKGLPFDTSDSLTLHLETSQGVCFDFGIDMNVKPDSIVSAMFVPALNSKTYSPLTMLSDKIVVVSSNKIYRRIKDVYDLYALSLMYSFRLSEIREMLHRKHGRVELKNMLVINNLEQLTHAWFKFTGIQNKPEFGIMFSRNKYFLEPIYAGIKEEYIWSVSSGRWIRP